MKPVVLTMILSMLLLENSILDSEKIKISLYFSYLPDFPCFAYAEMP